MVIAFLLKILVAMKSHSCYINSYIHQLSCKMKKFCSRMPAKGDFLSYSSSNPVSLPHPTRLFYPQTWCSPTCADVCHLSPRPAVALYAPPWVRYASPFSSSLLYHPLLTLPTSLNHLWPLTFLGQRLDLKSFPIIYCFCWHTLWRAFSWMT